LLTKAEPQPARDALLRVAMDTGEVARTSLRALFENTQPFKAFADIASKENGIDAEGLAFWHERLYVGFRGPVLRGNFTPVVRCRFDNPTVDAEILFLTIGGLGVRDLAAASDRLLVLAGPVGDGPGTYDLYAWDGRDSVPGQGAPASAQDSPLTFLGQLPPVDASGAAAKAEGLAIADETPHHWDVLVVYDGLKNGHGMRMRVEKP
jgi:hypothetical protein